MKNKKLYTSVILVTLGIALINTMKDASSAIGVVFIAIGGLFFILGMREMKREKENK